MKTAVTVAVLVASGSVMSVPEARQQSTFRLPSSTDRTLENGLRIRAMEFPELPLVNFHLVVRAGSSSDPGGKEGLADLTGDLLRKGTTSRSAIEIAEEIDSVGGLLDTETGLDATHVTAEFLADDVERGLALLADVMMNPAFTLEEVERLRGEKIAELKALREDPGALATRRFVELLYGEHPYGHPATGWEKSVGSLTREDVTSFYEAHYSPGSTILVVAGAIDAERMLDQIQQVFGRWDRSRGAGEAAPSLPAPAAPKARSIVLIGKPDSTQSQIRIGGVGIDRKDPDYIPLLVANTILGGGFTSRLVEEIRVNRGLSYGARSGFYTHLQDGPFLISTFTKNETTQETVQVALDVLSGFRQNGATTEELDKAKRYLKGTFAIRHQSAGAMAEAMADIAFYDLPSDYYDRYLERIEAVDLETVKRVASTRFPSPLLIVVLGESDEVRSGLRKIGAVTDAPMVKD